MPPECVPEPWGSFLAEVDSAFDSEIRFYCLGGFVMTVVYGLARSTADVDVLAVVPGGGGARLLDLAGKCSSLHRKHRVYLDLVTIVTVPEDYEDRLTEIFPDAFAHLRLFALDPYDVALAKIERNIQRDRDDVKHLARIVPFELDVLKGRYEKELRPYLGNPEREDLTLQLWIEAIKEERGR